MAITDIKSSKLADCIKALHEAGYIKIRLHVDSTSSIPLNSIDAAQQYLELPAISTLEVNAVFMKTTPEGVPYRADIYVRQSKSEEAIKSERINNIKTMYERIESLNNKDAKIEWTHHMPETIDNVDMQNIVEDDYLYWETLRIFLDIYLKYNKRKI